MRTQSYTETQCISNFSSFEQRTVSYTTSGGSEVGNEIGIRFIYSDTVGQVGIDNIALTIVPEPAAFALLAGAVGFAAVALRRKR